MNAIDDPFYEGEDVELTYTVANLGERTLDGAQATLRVSRRRGGKALMEKTQGDGIVLSGTTAVCSFNVDEISAEPLRNPATYFLQLRVTISGRTLVVAEETFDVLPLIKPAA